MSYKNWESQENVKLSVKLKDFWYGMTTILLQVKTKKGGCGAIDFLRIPFPDAHRCSFQSQVS